MHLRSREIPWLPVIQFHKEVVRRAEEAFFALPAGQLDSERWSSLVDFSLPDFAGPWRLPATVVQSAALARAIRSENVDTLFIGCGCWFRWHKGEKGWYVDWLPSIYREIAVEMTSDSEMRIVPAQGRWELSPLLFGVLDRKNVAPKRPLDQWLPELLDDTIARQRQTNDALDRAWIETLCRAIPELAEDFSREIPAGRLSVMPAQWVLFTPPASTSVFNRQLMADYEELERLLSSENADIGGLRLLEDAAQAAEAPEFELFPIVPLNPSQSAAVKKILGSEPVTVVSGPPGCGKSQVVVSALLNAWARGRSVIFASNNNKAVDVVKERVEKFETDFPIAIRAGARQVSNLEEALRRALNVVASKTSTPTASGNVVRQAKLLEEKKRLTESLESQVPQRIDQALRSGLNAYAAFRSAVAELEQAESEQEEALHALGYAETPRSFESNVLMRLRAWIQDVASTKETIQRFERERARILTEIAVARAGRDQAAQATGLQPSAVGSWDWLVSGPGPETFQAWLERCRALLSQPIDSALGPIEWQQPFSRWNSSAAATEWRRRALELSQSIRGTCGRLTPVLAKITDTRVALEERRARIASLDIAEDAAFDVHRFEEWSVYYSQYSTRAHSRLDWLPWSDARRIGRGLRRAEARLRTVLPLPVWRDVGVLNAEGRARLSEILVNLTRWIGARNAWLALDGDQRDVEGSFSSLRELSAQIGVQPVPTGWTIEQWRTLDERLLASTQVAEVAAIAWARRERQEVARKQLLRLAGDYKSALSGHPICDAWVAGPGILFDQAITTLGQRLDVESLRLARSALYTAPLGDLAASWTEARRAEVEARRLVVESHKVPTEDTIVQRWWAQHPGELPSSLLGAIRLPSEGDPILDHLAACEAWVREWQQFLAERRVQLTERIEKEQSWVRQQISAAQVALPESVDSTDARATIEAILASPLDQIPAARLQAAFAQFSPDSIRARIEGLDRQLQDLAFGAARDGWVNSLANDPNLQVAIEQLLRRYERNKGRLYREDHGLFESVLAALPIWITTAQAPQALPLKAGIVDLLIIDEATQCTLTNVIPLIYRAKRVAVIGDKEQLPAISTLSAAAEDALARTYGLDSGLLDLVGHAQTTVYSTFVQCLPRRHADVVQLDEHYRSHPLIIGFSNQHVYQQRLRLRKDPDQGVRVPSGPGVFRRHVEGTCSRGERGQSWINREEAAAVVETVRALRAERTFANFSLGVVTPFRAHGELVAELLDQAGLARGVGVGTAHRFQGDECDVMIFSPVVSAGIADSAATWVEKPHNLINVAITRAREALFVVANIKQCRQQPGILGKLARYVEDVETLRSTSPAELELFSWMVVQGLDPEIHPVVGDIEVDFVLRRDGRKLAIEVDGAQHESTTAADDARDAFLRARGFMTMRIPARAVMETPAVVMDAIEQNMSVVQ